MPGFMYQNLRDAIPVDGHVHIDVLEQHLAEQLERVKSALDKMHLISEAYGQLSELLQTSAEKLRDSIHQNNSRDRSLWSDSLALVDELSLSEEDKLRIKHSIFSSIDLQLTEMVCDIDLHFSEGRSTASVIARNAISD